MYGFIIAIHLLVCFVMIAVILLQSGKGAEMGAAFGGSSQTLFGSRGAGTFLSKVTIAAAVIFMLTSLSLAILSKHRSAASILENASQAPAAAPAVPGVPEQAPPANQGAAQPPAAPPEIPAQPKK